MNVQALRTFIDLRAIKRSDKYDLKNIFELLIDELYADWLR